jgi:preprotein translocase subunit SecE
LTPPLNGGIIKKRPGRAFKNAKNRMMNYFKDVRAEMKHVSWPSRSVTIAYTIVVVVVSLVVAIYLGLLDHVFRLVIQQFI